MKKNLIYAKRLFMTAFCSMVLSLGWATVNEKPFVIPELKEWNGAEGMFSPSGKYVVKGGKSAEEVAQLFASDYQDLVGKTLTPKNGKPSKGDIVLVLKSDKQLGTEGYNKKTCLYVNGKLREELGPLTVYAMQQKDLISFQKNDITAWQPIMYNPSAKMHYQRTLVFPLQQAGNFKSQITGVKVVQNQE